MNLGSLTAEFGGVTFGSLGVWTLVGGLIVAWLRLKPLMRKLQNESDGSLRADLLARIRVLEEQQISDRADRERQRAEDRRACEAEIEELRRERIEDRRQMREQDHLIDGLQRQLIMFQIATGRALPPEMRSPEIDKMIEALRPIFESGAGKSPTLRAVEDTCAAAEETVEQVKRDEARGEDPK